MPVAPVRTRWWGELLVVVWLAWVYDAVNNLAPLRLGPALAHGRAILNFETSLGIAPERALDRWLAAHHGLGLVVSDYYDNAHFAVTVGVLALLWWKGAERYRPMRNALVAINLLAFVVFWLFPVAPPRMLGRLHRRRRLDARDRLLAHRRARLGCEPARGDALAAHRVGALGTVGVWQLTRRPLLRALGRRSTRA